MKTTKEIQSQIDETFGEIENLAREMRYSHKATSADYALQARSIRTLADCLKGLAYELRLSHEEALS